MPLNTHDNIEEQDNSEELYLKSGYIVSANRVSEIMPSIILLVEVATSNPFNIPATDIENAKQALLELREANINYEHIINHQLSDILKNYHLMDADGSIHYEVGAIAAATIHYAAGSICLVNPLVDSMAHLVSTLGANLNVFSPDEGWFSPQVIE